MHIWVILSTPIPFLAQTWLEKNCSKSLYDEYIVIEFVEVS